MTTTTIDRGVRATPAPPSTRVARAAAGLGLAGTGAALTLPVAAEALAHPAPEPLARAVLAVLAVVAVLHCTVEAWTGR